MALPLPFTLGPDQDAIQGNFDFLRKRWPLSRKDMAIERPHVVGATGEPAFQNSWVNFDTTLWQGARFWKDPMGMVHLEGLVMSGATGTVIFTLPDGYRPLPSVLFGSDMNATVHARIDVAANGDVVARFGSGGTNVYVSLSGISFRQEH